MKLELDCPESLGADDACYVTLANHSPRKVWVDGFLFPGMDATLTFDIRDQTGRLFPTPPGPPFDPPLGVPSHRLLDPGEKLMNTIYLAYLPTLPAGEYVFHVRYLARPKEGVDVFSKELVSNTVKFRVSGESTGAEAEGEGRETTDPVDTDRND